MMLDNGASVSDRAVVPSGSSQQAVSPVPASIPSAPRLSFSAWIHALDEAVIQGEYGYEDGEYTVYPDSWRHMWREGLTPQQAFRRALDAHAAARREEDAAKALNWARIQTEDAQVIEARRAETLGSVHESAVATPCAQGAVE